MLKLQTVIFFVAIAFACGCSTTPKQPEPVAVVPQNGLLSERFDKLKIGDSREQVEQQLGRPFSYQRSEFGETSMYMAGMEEMMAQMRDMRSTAPGGGSMFSGILRSALGIAGMAAGPAGGIAAGIGSQVLSLGESVSVQASMPDANPGSMEMLMIRYRDGKVISLERQTPGQMGTLPGAPQIPAE